MTKNPPSQTSLVTLPLPRLPAAEYSDGAGGRYLGIGYHNIRNPEQGPTILLGPHANMTTGDTYRVYWGDPDNAILVHAITNENSTIARMLPTERLQAAGEGSHPVWYTLTLWSNESGVPDGSSDPVAVLADFDVPGGLDPDGTTDFINEALAPAQAPELIEDASGGVDVTIPAYLHMGVGDRITLAWGTLRREVRLDSESQVGLPVVFALTQADIEAGGDGRVVVTYWIYDRVGDWSKRAPPKIVEVETGVRLPEPLVLDADENGVIDLEMLAGADVQVRVLRYTAQAQDDEVVLTWQGYTGEGLARPPLEQTKLVSSNTAAYTRFDIPNAEVTAIAQGNAVVRYVVHPVDGSAERPSKRTTVSVVGEAVSLAKPVVQESPDQQTLDPADAPNGATVRVDPYGFMQAGDTVHLHWRGTTAGGGSVVDYQSRRISESGNGQPVLFVVAADKVTALAGGSVEVQYEVTPATRAAAIPSQPLRLQVLGESALLPKPRVLESPDQIVLDPDDVSAAGASVRIAAYPGMAAGDRVQLTWNGSAANGDHADSLPIGSGEIGLEVPFQVPKQFVDANLNGTAAVSYRVVPAAGMPSNSETLDLRIGAAELVLPAPTVDQAPSGTLNPVDAVGGLTVRVPANAALLPSDQVTVTWRAEAGVPVGGSHTSPAQAGNPSGMVFTVPASVVAYSVGRPVTVVYTVTRDGVPQESQPLTVSVQAFASGDLPLPRITQAVGDELDLDVVADGGELTVAPWPLIALGQRISLRLEGTRTDGSAHHYPHPDWQNYEIASPDTVTNGPKTTIPASYLQQLQDASELKLIFEVAFDGSTDRKTGFPLRTYRVKAPDIPVEFTSVRGTAGQIIGNGETTTERTVSLHGRAKPLGKVEIRDNGVQVRVVDVDSQGDWSLAGHNVTVGQHDFIAKAEYGTGQQAEYMIRVREKLNMSWNFDDGTLQGWRPNGPYAAPNECVVENGAVRCMTIGPQTHYDDMVMVRSVDLIPGVSYAGSFKVKSYNGGSPAARIQMFGSGTEFGGVVEAPTSGWATGSGTFVATSDPAVPFIGIHNHTRDYIGNDFLLDDITIREL